MRRARTRGAPGAFPAPGTVRFERLLPGPVERIWSYLTDSEKRGLWLATGAMEPRVGGRIEHVFRHADLSPTIEPVPERYQHMKDGHAFTGRITRYEPPYVLAYTWGEAPDASEVTFDLSPRGEDVLLVLTHRRLGARQERISVAGGWHTHLALLEDRLHGEVPPSFWSLHTALEAEYEQVLAGEE
ncbi:SRPBCC family protein [Melittangium boletus]|uniref:Aha1 domain-containing protein n=1 Tax=Melittangium boletus DSM 14713 TaxID=1294270 RepID=A0A250IHW1_9BACT|nr:SRPBCC family protein [Melittangium boletus]ATB30810.1 Aha1 domain-containing protein [Melittangium boletus DSM 14713]